MFNSFKYLSLASMFLSAALYPVDFVLFTQQKTGKHLLMPILMELTGKEPYCPRAYMKQVCKGSNGKPLEVGFPCTNAVIDEIWETNKRQGSYLHFHTPYSPDMEQYLIEKGQIVFFVKRDPRDHIVSLLNHYKYIDFLDKEIESIPSDEERLLRMIRKKLRAQVLNFKGWLGSPICCVLDFSKLMGAHGGAATDADTMEELRKIATALDLNISDSELKAVHEKHFGKGTTFFKGKVNAWKEYFNEKHKAAVKQEIGDLLIELGYEKDYNW